MGRIRPFVKDYIPRLVELNAKLFSRGAELSPQKQLAQFEEAFLRNPWYDESLPSLTYEDADGRLIGFLGVIARRMSFKERTIRLAVSQHMMVDPERRSSLASIELLRTFLSGPQDVSMADTANDVSQKMWERLGGFTSLLHSIWWRRPLRPVGAALAYVRKRNKLLVPLALASRPLSITVDAIATRLRRSPFHIATSQTPEEDLGAENLLACLSEFSQMHSLRPEYDRHSLQWLLDILAQQKDYGTFKTAIVRNAKKGIRGWYMYYLNPNEMSEVIQIGATGESIKEVLVQLFYHAWQQGAVDLSGRLEPRFMKEFSAMSCFFFPGRMWMLLHSRNPELLKAIDRDDMFLSRLEGDLWLV